MKTLILVTLLVAVSGPAIAGITPCTTAMVTAGVCRDAANTILHWDAPTATLVELRDAIAAQEGYRDLVTCEQTMVDAALCDIADLNTLVTNPVTRTEFADAWILQALQNKVRRQRVIDARVDADSGVDPDVDVE